MTNRFKNILVSDGGYNRRDYLLASPAVARIKGIYPASKITVVAPSNLVGIYDDNPNVDETLTLDSGKNWWINLILLFKEIRSKKFDTFINLKGPRQLMVMAWINRIPFRGGLIANMLARLVLKDGIRQVRSFVEMHDLEYDVALLESMGVKYHHQEKGKLQDGLDLSEVETNRQWEKIAGDLERQGLAMPESGEVIFLYPKASTRYPGLSLEGYARLVTMLEEKFPGRFLFCVWSSKSLPLHFFEVNERSLAKRIFYFESLKRDLVYLAALLKRASLFIGHGTGAPLSAGLLGVKMVGIYSPIKNFSALRWGPPDRSGSKVKVMVPDVVCGEHHKCSGSKCLYHNCMNTLEVSDIFDAALELLENQEIGNMSNDS